MHTLRMLGGVGLTDAEGREAQGLLRQPKHVALLVYLALPRPGTWHRRDSVLGVLWPEHEQARARTTLRSALYTLRGHLAKGTVAARGDDELSVDPALIRTDVALMSDDLARQDFASALARYQGELLPGIYVSNTGEFEEWIGGERRRVRGMARTAADGLARTLEKAGDLSGAVTAARHAAELDPDDEAAARRLIALLDRSGDRAGAFAVYDKFRTHMADTFGVRPSAETVALLDAVRTRRGPVSAPVDAHDGVRAEPSPHASTANPAQEGVRVETSTHASTANPAQEGADGGTLRTVAGDGYGPSWRP